MHFFFLKISGLLLIHSEQLFYCFYTTEHQALEVVWLSKSSMTIQDLWQIKDSVREGFGVFAAEAHASTKGMRDPVACKPPSP